jgi:uncharacterized surface protein with fasciclin (FAS1) repeats
MEQSSNKSIITAVVLAVVLLGGVGAFVATRDKDDKNTNAVVSQSKAPEKSVSAVPKPKANIVGLAAATPSLSTLVTAVTKAELVETLSGTGPFTVFAPNNDAFAALPAGTLDSLLLPENKAKLQAVLTYHVVSGKVMSTDLSDGQIVKTVQGNNLTVVISGGKVMLKDATGAMSEVISADIEASNGVVHVIKSVVLPE